jgi:nitrogen fixation protein NifU and related proteins
MCKDMHCMDLYAENILDHFRHPRNGGMLPDATADHQEFNHACGDSLHLWLTLDGGTVTKIGWKGEGCAISQASMSIVSEEMIGKSEEDVQKLSKNFVYELLGVPIGPRRFKCALMSLHTVKNTLRKAHDLTPQSWIETVAVEEDERMRG